MDSYTDALELIQQIATKLTFLRVFKISQKYTNVRLEEDSLFPPAFSKLVDYKNNRYIEYENYIKEFDAFSMNSEERKDLIGEYWNIKLYSPIQYIPQGSTFFGIAFKNSSNCKDQSTVAPAVPVAKFFFEIRSCLCICN